jgi:hypothetical protein
MRIISGKYVGELNVKCINCNSYYNYDELLKRDNSKPLNGADGRTPDDLISRAAAIAEIEEYIEEYSELEPETGYHNLKWCAMEEAKDVLSMLPAVDAVPVVHARWIYKERHRKSYRQYTGFDDAGETHTITVLEESEGKEPYCSECGAQAAESFLEYCPHCGAKMGGERRDDDAAD